MTTTAAANAIIAEAHMSEDGRQGEWRMSINRMGSMLAAVERQAVEDTVDAPTTDAPHVHEYDYRDSRCVVSGLYPPSCEECGACVCIDTCACGFQRRLDAPTPDAPLRAAATRLVRDGWNHTNYVGCWDAFPDRHDEQSIPDGVDCPACQAIKAFFRAAPNAQEPGR
jgi:hypothetical protein